MPILQHKCCFIMRISHNNWCEIFGIYTLCNHLKFSLLPTYFPPHRLTYSLFMHACIQVANPSLCAPRSLQQWCPGSCPSVAVEFSQWLVGRWWVRGWGWGWIELQLSGLSWQVEPQSIWSPQVRGKAVWCSTAPHCILNPTHPPLIHWLWASWGLFCWLTTWGRCWEDRGEWREFPFGAWEGKAMIKWTHSSVPYLFNLLRLCSNESVAEIYQLLTFLLYKLFIREKLTSFCL